MNASPFTKWTKVWQGPFNMAGTAVICRVLVRLVESIAVDRPAIPQTRVQRVFEGLLAGEENWNDVDSGSEKIILNHAIHDLSVAVMQHASSVNMLQDRLHQAMLDKSPVDNKKPTK